MKAIFYSFLIIFIISGCTVEKYLQVTGGSKADGTLQMKYTYGSFEDPDVQWGNAKRKAIDRCKQWGYSDAEFFESGTKECVSADQYGCNKWMVTYKVQCVNE